MEALILVTGWRSGDSDIIFKSASWIARGYIRHSRHMFQEILQLIAELRPKSASAPA
jgi:hypothetical protein